MKLKETKIHNMTYSLRDYQEIGKNELFLSNSFLLADDMGLGKTVQAISALKNRFEQNGVQRVLIVVPNSLRTNWKNEFAFWFSGTKITILDGDKENKLFYLKNSKSVIITTYEQIRTLFTINNAIPTFDIAIFDEAQRLKNSNSATYQASKLIKAETKWMLTGTPLENSEDDIVNLFSILKPGTIHKGFNNLEIKNGIEPHYLRRRKEECLEELPELIEENVYIDMTKEQRQEYDNLYLQKYSWYKSNNLLAFITQLKQICNFPEEPKNSAKLKNLNNILNTKFESKEKVIIFSQYVETLKQIKNSLKFDFLFYDGSLNTIEKDNVIKQFQEDDSKQFLLMSLKAGGVGLNLQEANTIILYDRWWNPAVEAQAIARAHRMGNKNKVHAIKYVVSNSVEEKIIEILHEKEYLFNQIVENKKDTDIKNNKNVLAELVDLKITDEENNIKKESDKNGTK